MAGGLSWVLAAILFAATGDFWLLLLAATIGVISPSGNEVSVLPIEQAALSQELPDERAAICVVQPGRLRGDRMRGVAGGQLTQRLEDAGFEGASVYRPLLIVYGVMSLLARPGIRLPVARGGSSANKKKSEAP